MLSIILWLLAIVAFALVAAIAWLVLRTRWIAARAERDVPMKGRTMRVGGDTIRYGETGEGRPVLFIHGLGAQLHHFTHSLFEAMGAGWRMVAIDRPGSGYSVRAGSPRIVDQADQIARFIDAVGLGKPLVVGHSLGGAIALALALRHPDKVAGLALIAPLTNHVPRPPEAFGGLYIVSPLRRRILAETVAVPMSQKLADQTLRAIFGPEPPPADYMSKGGGSLGLRPSHFYATASDLVSVELDLPAQQQRYGELSMPVGIIYGERDQVLDHVEQGLWMADKVPGIEIELIPGTGHMPNFTQPDRVAAFVRRIADRAFAT